MGANFTGIFKEQEIKATFFYKSRITAFYRNIFLKDCYND
jgi:hypothetical protein